jgi:hypothetical protein
MSWGLPQGRGRTCQIPVESRWPSDHFGGVTGATQSWRSESAIVDPHRHSSPIELHSFSAARMQPPACPRTVARQGKVAAAALSAARRQRCRIPAEISFLIMATMIARSRDQCRADHGTRYRLPCHDSRLVDPTDRASDHGMRSEDGDRGSGLTNPDSAVLVIGRRTFWRASTPQV